MIGGSRLRLQILSDLHLELGGGTPDDVARRRGLGPPDVGADAIVLAGDIAGGVDGVRWAAATWPDRPVLYVPGNHEFYDREVGSTLDDCRAAARGTTVHVLDHDAVTIDGVRFLGATLWTDFALFGDPARAEAAAARCMMDFHVIRGPAGGPLRPHETRVWHHEARAWLEHALADAATPTVVITHHAPHPRSDRVGDLASAAFVSDLAGVIERYRPRLWIHGHTHACEDYGVGGTRVVSNQAGYVDEATGFDAACTVDLDAAGPSAAGRADGTGR